MTIKELRDAMKGLKGDTYVEVTMPAQGGGKWLMSIIGTSKTKDRLQIKINNPLQYEQEN